MLLNTDLTQDLLQAAENAGLNASAPPQQEMLDGWLIRLSPGKAKRSRCVNALAQGKLPLNELLARCTQAFERAGLPLVVRITPFTRPADLDQQLAALGWEFFDDTRVMLKADLSDLGKVTWPEGCVLHTVGHAEYAQAVGILRGSSQSAIEAHAERMQQSPVPYVGMLLKRGDELLACGQFVREGALVGLYDIFTVPEQRGQGLGRSLCTQLLGLAREQGARSAYLQVSADNDGARSVYQRMGFVDGYGYHYRTPDLKSVY
ncbi:MAG: GNAT family N-acetyltransferase [Burkholderiaceae bacterium]|nr:GNAT family N-acetyltransferase [Burkholderiaceae bacterium]